MSDPYSLSGSCRTALARLACVALFLAASVGPANAQTLEVRVRAGFFGYLIQGHPFPITATVENGSGFALEARLVLEDGVGILPTEIVGRKFSLAAGAGRQITLLGPPFRGQSLGLRLYLSRAVDVGVEWQGGEREEILAVKEVSIRLESAQFFSTVPSLGLVLGDRGRHVADVLSTRGGRLGSANWLFQASDQFVPLVSMDPISFPDSHLALDGVPLIFWFDPEPGAWQNPAQADALMDWVRFGGILVIFTADRADRLRDPSLTPFLPVHSAAVGVMAYPRLRSASRVDPGRGPVLRGALRADAVWKSAASRFEKGTTADVGLGRYEWSVGRGRIVLANFDPLNWDQGDGTALAWALASSAGIAVRNGSVRTGGYVGRRSVAFAAPMLDGVLQNGNILAPNVGLFVFLGLVFVVLIGPVDYMVLKRRGKLHWSPITLLVYSALFSGGAFLATMLLFAPDEEVNRVVVLDLLQDEQGRELAEGYLYQGVYEPLGATVPCDVPAWRIYGLTATGNEFNRLGGSGRQVWDGAGRQFPVMEIPFNGFRLSGNRISGEVSETVTCRWERQEDGSFGLVVHNGFGNALENMRVVKDGKLYLFRGTLRAGESKTFALVRARDIRGGNLAVLRGSSQRDALELSHAARVLLRTMSRRVTDSADDRHRYRRNVSPPFPWVSPPGGETGDAFFLASTTAPPFEDALVGRRHGFDLVIVRRRVPSRNSE